MKNITKRKDGRWCGRIQINKKQICVYAKTKKECINKLKLAKNTPIKKESKIKLYDFAKKWFNEFKKKEISVNSQKLYKGIIETHIIKLNKDIKNINTNEIQEFLNKLPPTRIKEMCIITIKQIFRKAKELKIIKDNPCEYISKGKIERTKRDWFNINEQKQILNKIKESNNELLLKTLILTGARPNELNGLKKEDVKDGYIHIKGTKTKNSDRWVKISERLEKELKSKSEIIFKYCLSSLQKEFRRMLKELSIQGSLYSLRHTFASNLYYMKVPDKERQSYLGHSSIIITNDIYTTFDPTIKKEDILNLYKDLYPTFWHNFWHNFFTKF